MLLLICREVQFLDSEARDQAEPATGTAGTLAARRATGTTTARTTWGTILCRRSQGQCGHHKEAENHKER